MAACLACSLTYPVHSACLGGSCSCPTCTSADLADTPELRIRELLAAVEDEVRGAGTVQARRLVRRVRAWADEVEPRLTG